MCQYLHEFKYNLNLYLIETREKGEEDTFTKDAIDIFAERLLLKGGNIIARPNNKGDLGGPIFLYII